jgi:hypothetical protein
MKRLIPTICILILAATSFAQSVTKIELAKDNGRGKPGQVVKSFAPNDNPFHCVLQLKPLTGPTVFVGTLIAVRAADVTNYTVATTNLAAGARMESLDFKLSLTRDWPTGSYRVEVKVNGKTLKDVSFEIK